MQDVREFHVFFYYFFFYLQALFPCPFCILISRYFVFTESCKFINVVLSLVVSSFYPYLQAPSFLGTFSNLHFPTFRFDFPFAFFYIFFTFFFFIHSHVFQPFFNLTFHRFLALYFLVFVCPSRFRISRMKLEQQQWPCLPFDSPALSHSYLRRKK